ncbi:hypothetical protein F5X96DRAFT_367437 [Biscogniauxia mediterranea]|nr:hypothetical protein F5X96DRAFT_367437 [Biscogniauxia mediterranea]
MASQSRNVFMQPLRFFSAEPMTGYFRDGYCRTTATVTIPTTTTTTTTTATSVVVVEDPGNHAVAAVVTDEFLDYSASRGNDLRSGLGLRGGCRWCLCSARWLEAYRAYRAGRVSMLGVPRVDLDATEESALRTVDLQTLRQFAVREPEGGGNGSHGAA